MRYEALMKRPALVTGKLGMFDKSIEEFLRYKKANPNVAIVIGADAYQALLVDYTNFKPTEKHEDLKQGICGKYRGMDVYSDAYSSEKRFLDSQTLKLIRIPDESSK